MSDAVAAAVEQAREHVADDPIKHVDATGWRQAGEARTLWTIASAAVTVFFITKDATTAGLRGLSVAVVWRTVHGRPSPQSPYVGSWRFTSGEIKAGPGFFVSDKVAPDGTTSQPLTGHVAVVELRNGTLWYLGDDGKSCSYELRVGDGKAEVVPGGKVDCDTSTGDGVFKRPDVRMSMVIDAQDRAHVSGEARTSIEYKGEHREVTVTYEGTAVRVVPTAPDGGV